MPNNTLLTPTIITKESLMMLENNLVMAKRVNRQFENKFVKIGASLTVRKPNRFTVTSGPALSIQDVTEQSTVVTVNQQKHVDFQFSSQDLSLTIEEFSSRYLKPAMATLANQIDYDLCGLHTDIFNLIGTPGTTPATALALLQCNQRLNEEGAPRDGTRTLVINPAAETGLIDGLKGLYAPSSVGASVEAGKMRNIAGLDIMMDQNIQTHTVGALGGTPLVNGANQTGSSLITNGWTAAAAPRLAVGDCFTLAGVFAVNPQNRQSTGVLKNFVVTAAMSSDGAGNGTISISPAITTTGAFQTVTVSPANGAALTILSGAAATAYPQNLAFHRDAFGLVMVPLEIPGGVDFAARETYKNISMRMIRAYDINNDVFPVRLDVLYGTKTYYPELGVKLTG